MSTEEYLEGLDTDNELLEEESTNNDVAMEVSNLEGPKRTFTDELSSDENMDDDEDINLMEEDDNIMENTATELSNDEMDSNGVGDNFDDEKEDQDLEDSIEVVELQDINQEQGNLETIVSPESAVNLDSEEEIENLEEIESLEETLRVEEISRVEEIRVELVQDKDDQEDKEEQSEVDNLNGGAEIEVLDDLKNQEDDDLVDSESIEEIEVSEIVNETYSQENYENTESSLETNGKIHTENFSHADDDNSPGVTETETTNLETEEFEPQDLHNVSSVPLFLCICGDEYLLAPFFEKSNYKLEDMISLFSMDEVTGKSLDQFFQLLRGNGDLIDAYNFDVEDELRIDIPELSISVTEDNVFARELKLDDIISCFYALRENSIASLKTARIPDKLTLLISMQQRFASRYHKLQRLANENATFAQVFGPEHSNSELPNKKRKLSI